MSSFDERVRNLIIIFAVVLSIPLIVFLLAEFKINPLVSPVIGTWAGSLYYNDSVSSQVNAVFTFTDDGNCSINMSYTYWAGDSYATRNIYQTAQWITKNGNCYLVYDNNSIPLNIETISSITGSTTRLYIQNETVSGTPSQFQGFLVQSNG